MKLRDLNLLLDRAEAALRAGQFEDSVHIARTVTSTDPTHVGALEILASALWQSSKYSELLETIRTLTRLNPYEPGYHALTGAALQCLGRYGESVRAFSRGAEAPGSTNAVRVLHSWQASLVRELIETDAVFKAHYAQDPCGACSSRGFEFAPEIRTDPWLPNGPVKSRTFVRPS
jgi:hypothetical protein